MSKKFIFSGHESFQCRQLWLKKGYDYIRAEKSFNADDAVVALGVGKNMVTSIKFWMKAFGIILADDTITPFGESLLNDNGWDPYLENEASLWLLHYQLVKNGFASTYSLVFNELRKEKIEFTKENYTAFVRRKAEGPNGFQVNEKTLSDDFNVFAKLYMRSDAQTKDREDSFSGLLTELDIIKSYHRGKDEYFIIENTDKPEIPDEVVLYAILDQDNFELSVNISSLESEPNSVGSIFALSKSGLLNKIESIASKSAKSIIFNDHAGVREMQFKRKPIALNILDRYYAN